MATISCETTTEREAMTPDEQARALWKNVIDELQEAKRAGLTGKEMALFIDGRTVPYIAAALRAHERAVWEEAAKGAEEDLTGDPEDAVNIYLRDYADWCRQRAEEP